MERKQKQTWFITGCSSGIGRVLAEEVLRRGDQAAVTARSCEAIRDLEERWPDTALILPLDVTDERQGNAAVCKTLEHFGKIDVLVNNAGYGFRGALEEAGKEEISRLFRTNLFGPVYLMQEVLPHMRARHSGMIVNISSSGALEASVGSGFYAASKAALEQISDSLRKETAELGIEVMIVEPGAMRTDFRDRSLQQSEIVLEAYSKTSGARRKENLPSLHDQAGDPARLAEELVSLVHADAIPERILFGTDAVKTAEKIYHKRLLEMETWRDVSVSTDFS